MISIVGPAYTLANRKASIQRAVNLYLSKMEAAGKSAYILQSVPGLILRATVSGEYRGSIETNDRAFMVYGSTLYEISSTYVLTARGTLATFSGAVSMAYGVTQVVVVDGPSGYVFTLATNVFTQITSAAFSGATTVDFADNYFTLTKDRSGQQFQITSINDALTIDALDFASAEGSPDDLVGHLVVQAGILLFGTLTCELWVNTGAADFPFERSRGSGFQVGLMAAASLKLVDNGPMWIGRDKSGSGIVYRLIGGQPSRVSNQAVEQALQSSTALTEARAWCYQDKGLTFYAINAPGLTSTWVYEISTGAWAERNDIDSLGQYMAGRVTGSLFAFGKHLAGDAAGKVYEWSETTYTNAGDVLIRERTSPHEAVPGRVRQFFSQFYADVTTGGAAQSIDPMVELSYSDDAGKSWSNPLLRSLGKAGEILARLLWTRLGASRDRVWKIKCSANAPFSIVDAAATSTPGAN